MTVVELIALSMLAVALAAIVCALAVAVALWWTRRHPPHAQRSISHVAGRRERP
ncbi:hypothetical protein [Candidatus Mycolicibacterium alkanivorans]|uniref:Uncharacterized protein n=1 Tax=Candidatus Mycolicibacterium alkanivorans TaxID=2954114 RepID=A0ABS9YSD3_9MYCO|nr:hypothetical protein [Candidatus Mycolicibacterium alkanivorans]MCI4674126.1 hypothetical protein [Candidatus Mycolicibacterium alkanivorans]